MDRIKTKFPNDIEVQHVFHAKQNKPGNYAIYVRFYIHQKTIRVQETLVSTGITAATEKWNGSTIKGTDVHTKEKNERLAEILILIRDALFELKNKRIGSVQDVICEIENGLKVQISGRPPKGQREKYLSMLIDHTLESVKDDYLGTVTVSKTYRKNFRLALQKFNEWWKSQYSYPTPAIRNITTADIKAFKNWAERQGITHNTVSTYMNRLRTIFNHAVNRRLIPESPVPKGLIEGYKKGAQAALTIEEVQKFKQIPDGVLTHSQKQVKYIFLFLCSTAMGYGELKSLRLEHIERQGDDLIIAKEREKTGIPFYLPMSKLAKYIYLQHLYKPGNVDQPFKNLPTIEYVTRVLKILGAMAGINKNLSTYVGRKTFATQWANAGNDIYYLSTILGHTDVRRTMDYISLNKKLAVEYGKEALARNAFHCMN